MRFERHVNTCATPYIYNIYMSKNLVIVESPSKAKTIGKYLGDGYKVLSSKGHICDIEGYGKNSIGIDFENNYTPNYVVSEDKQALLASLRREADKAEVVWLASDPDREGEAIAWHLQHVLELPDKKVRRVAYPEIIKSVVLDAFEHPRDIDLNLVNAQQARRVLDRIVGFELSPILWRKVATGLSAGRVQSVAVRLIVEREREIENFKESSNYRVTANFEGLDVHGTPAILRAELKQRFASKEEAMAFLESCKTTHYCISSITHKPSHRSPAPPFTTSLLQQEASRKLKFSVSKTMRLAQSLYEAGHITYMRTDSVNLSGLAIAAAKEEIVKNYGEKYHKARQYQTKSKGAQEAHEAIRPTYMSTYSAGATSEEKRLYELIWKRTMASQMADADALTTRIEITNSDNNSDKWTFICQGEVIQFDGFMKMYIQANDNDSDDENETSMLPQMSEHSAVICNEFTAQQIFSKAPMRYSDAMLVKEMETRGIGRPSTFATIVETIQSRKYVLKGAIQGKKREYNVLSLKGGKIYDKMRQETYGQDSMKFIPTDLGRITNDFLIEQFPDILDYDFTATEEEKFDSIATGEANWTQVVDEFYRVFHPGVVAIPSGKVAGRKIGIDPATGDTVWAKVSKVGPCVQIGDTENGKPRFASLQKGQSLFTITLEEALALFKIPKTNIVCQIDGEDVISGNGKYGPYIRHKGTFISIPRDKAAQPLTEELVRTLIEAHKEASKPIRDFGDIAIMQGRYGAYIKAKNGNYRLPKSVDASTITREECQQYMNTSKSSTKK